MLLQWPDAPASLPPTQAMYAAPVASATPGTPLVVQRQSRLPVWIEFFSGALGIHGIGYLLAGEVRTAILWFIFSFFWEALRASLAVVTLGTSCLCLGPAGLVISILVSIQLNRVIRKKELAAAVHAQTALS